MQGSINFDGSLVGNITGGGGGGGDTVVITPVVTSGTKIADVSVNGVEKDLYCPTPPTPTEIDITPVVTSGTKIADVSLNGVEKDLYVPNPTTVNVTQVQQSGTKIATIGVNGVNTDIYTPEGGGSDVEITPVVTSGTKIADVSVGGVEKDLYIPDYGADITALDGRLDIAEDNITSLTGRVGTAEGNITNLAGHMTEVETDITEMKQSLSTLGVGDEITFTPATNVIDVSNSDYKEGKICIINHTVNFTATAGAWFTIGTVDKIPVDVSRTYGIKPSDGSLVGMISINTNGTIQIFPSIAINSSNVSFNISYRTNS